MRTRNSRPAWRADLACPAPAVPPRRARAAVRLSSHLPSTPAMRSRSRSRQRAPGSRRRQTLASARAIAPIEQRLVAHPPRSTATHSSLCSTDQMCSSASCINSPRSRSLKPGTRPFEPLAAAGAFPQSREMRSATAPSRSPRRGCARRLPNGGAISSVNCSSSGADLQQRAPVRPRQRRRLVDCGLGQHGAGRGGAAVCPRLRS